jgi:hypothetical protein
LQIVEYRSGSQETEHVPDAHMFFVAVADNLDFTLEEYNHMKHCETWLRKWKEYLDDRARHEDQLKEAHQLKRLTE